MSNGNDEATSTKLGITIGVCAMAKKVTGKPMKEIMRRLEDAGFTMVVFEEKVIFDFPVEEWPSCDCLIAFYSDGFPLAKVEAYTDLRKPYVVNDLHLQWTLMDRIKMYKLLEQSNVPIPRHVVVDHNSPDCQFEHFDDHVVCHGIKLKKPLVEKPQDGDDHNVRIYWPNSSGGGCTNLFRKIGDRSSEYCEGVTNVRTDGIYLYEEFVNTAGVDVKVYTCGPHYAHAEARKAPAMDGRVQRNERGKEERYPVILSEAEKSIARNVVLAFKQNICGLDMLRSKNGSIVCDVNGWSFVKDSTKYWDDTAQTLGMACQNAVAQMRNARNDSGGCWLDSWDASLPFLSSPLAIPVVRQTTAELKKDRVSVEKLLCVSIVARHADRTPKQKMKMTTKNPKLLAFCDVKSKEEEVKLKQTADLQKLLEVSIELLEGEDQQDVDIHKVRQLRQVLEMSPLEGLSFYRKVQLKPKKMDGDTVSEMQLILKWGGKLTWAGKTQAMDLGHEMRVRLYPARDGFYKQEAGGSLLRLHSTYRHDLKIYTSDEGRVILSAAAFVKGLLDLDGALPPITSMMLQSDDAATRMLDIMPEEARGRMDQVKADLSKVMHADPDTPTDEMLDEAYSQLGSPPHEGMLKLQQLICELVDELTERRAGGQSPTSSSKQSNDSSPLPIVPHMDHAKSDPVEKFDFVYTRWRRLSEEFFDAKKQRFDISKLPDIYDCSLYDILHNGPLQLKKLPELHEQAASLAKFMVPLEYGISKEQKSIIGMNITNRLLRKLYGDLHKEVDDSDATEYLLDHHAVNDSDISQKDRRVHTRLYFTSESHIISLMNVFRWGHIRDGAEGQPLLSPEAIALYDSITKDGMAFLTHLVLTVHESIEYPDHSLDRFRVRMLFSPGANSKELDVSKAVPLTPPEGLPLGRVARFLDDILCFSDNEWAGLPDSKVAHTEGAPGTERRKSKKKTQLGYPLPVVTEGKLHAGT